MRPSPLHKMPRREPRATDASQVRALGPPDAELVARACDGDRAAEEALYRRHVRYVAGIVTRLLFDPDEADDVIQETFLVALESLARLRDGGAVRGWLAQIAVSRVRRRFRRRKLLRLLGLDRTEDGALEELASRDADDRVRGELMALGVVLGGLAIEERIAWTLRHVEGFSLEEVAAACDCSLATVKRRVSRANAAVKAVMGDSGDGDAEEREVTA
jgi:RNA polymerase sigma-70 factor (ECF subfamily)